MGAGSEVPASKMEKKKKEAQRTVALSQAEFE
jgi:hypothetical protein